MISLKLGDNIDEAIQIISNNGVISYPTDTLYGLGGNPFSQETLDRIIAIKGRPTDKGLPLLLDDAESMMDFCLGRSDIAILLAREFWPGSLTLVLPAAPCIHPQVTGSKGTVALRVPNHTVPRALARSLGGTIVGTSANPSGGNDPINAHDVERMLGSKVDYILNGGPAYRGLPSTILDITKDRPKIIRDGALSRAAIEKVCGFSLD